MGKSRWRIVLFFVCIVFALLSPSRLASSQSLTTLTTMHFFASTSITAFTSTLTSTVVAHQAVQFDLTPSDFNNKTDTFTLSYSETAPYYPNNPLCLMYDYFLVNANATNEFKIEFDTQQNIPIHFFILNMDQFNQFNHTNCANGFSNWELHVVAPASTLVWVVPRRGEYAFLFISPQFVGGYVHMSLQAYGQSIEVSTSTYATTGSGQITRTQTAVSTLPATPASTGYSAFVVGAVIVLAVVAVAVLWTKRGPKKWKVNWLGRTRLSTLLKCTL